MAQQFERLKAALADRYAIERELGAGGMATVYLAEDLKHHRPVAVKVLRPELAAVLGAERFLREIEITARLTHPHILTLLDSGEVEGFLYYVMPYVDGESLRDRLNREKQLPLDDALQFAREVADALSYAHSRDVIHRDIKPENILLEAGHAVIADFGIARAVTAAGGDHLTETGVSIGTPHYMSPEQCEGASDIDGRTDIYALGSVLYELLAGEPPYTGPTAQAIIAKRLSEPVPHVSTLRETVPPTVEAAINKALAKAPADRYATAGQLAEALERQVVPQTASTTATSATGSKRWYAVGAVALAVILGVWLAVGTLGSGGASGDLPRIVVLPLENLSSSEEDFFADGMTEEITSRLAGISGLRIISRQTAIQYKGSTKTAQEIAAELDVDYILEGTVRTDRTLDGGGQVRITPQLIRASDDTHLWANAYTADLVPGEIFRIQAEIAERITESMNVVLLEPERQVLAAQPTDNQEAYDHYLRGENYFRSTSYTEAVAAYERAVQLDPDFAVAWAKLAEARAFAYFLFAYSGYSGTIEQAEAALERAQALAPEAAETYLAEGAVWFFGLNAYDEGIQAFSRALELRPGAVEPLYYLSLVHTLSLRLDDAAELIEQALDLDPLNSAIVWQMGFIHAALWRFQEARRYFDRAIALVPDASIIFYQRWAVYMWGLGLAYVRRDTTALEALFEERDDASRLRYEWLARLHRLRGDLARQEVYGDSMRLAAEKDVVAAIDDEVPPVSLERARSLLAVALALAGDEERAIRTIELAVERVAAQPDLLNADIIHYNAIRTYTFLGHTDTAIERIDSLFSWRRSMVFTPNRLRLDPDFDPLRDNPRFQALLAKYEN